MTQNDKKPSGGKRKNPMTRLTPGEERDLFRQYYLDAIFHCRESPGQAFELIQEALNLQPDNAKALAIQAELADRLNKPLERYESLKRLYEQGDFPDMDLPILLEAMTDANQMAEAEIFGLHLLARMADLNISRRQIYQRRVEELVVLARRAQEKKAISAVAEKVSSPRRDVFSVLKSFSTPPPRKTRAVSSREKCPIPVAKPPGTPLPRQKNPVSRKPASPKKDPPPVPAPVRASAVPVEPLDVDVRITVDTSALEAAFMGGGHTPEIHALALEAHRIRMRESFDHLICLGTLQEFLPLWYQEETVRKILKRFRGRALLADEVGMGKTIESLMVFAEYRQRGMIQSGLILTPSPLVSQWKNEMLSKFGYAIPSTDDPDFKTRGDEFWREPFLLVSLNQAKSKRHFDLVTARDYDIVIVDEAHHLKNRNTLNWKLVNALKRKFLLLLTATPVENNLMELYNLVTLLKPGQLKTASAFREEFMTRGDATDPRNRERLKELLGEVMIRNTRAVSNLKIPPRFAQTIRVEASGPEREMYEGVDGLVRRLKDDGSRRLTMKHLLGAAGSSPVAVALSLERHLEGDALSGEHRAACREILDICRKVGESRKNRMLLQLLRSHPGKMIVFVNYNGTLDHVRTFLTSQGIDCARFHGGMSNEDRDAEIRRFEAGAEVLVTTEIGGEGRNLQFCHQMVNYDLPWNPMKIEQRVGRIHRIGQECEVHIFNLCSAGSIEDHILDILDRKINMFEMVIGEIDMILGRVKDEREFSDMVFDIWVDHPDGERERAFGEFAAQLKRSKTSYLKTRELDDKLFRDEYEI